MEFLRAVIAFLAGLWLLSALLYVVENGIADMPGTAWLGVIAAAVIGWWALQAFAD